MEWWMLFMMGLANPAVPAAAMVSPQSDGLTLDPLPAIQLTQPFEGLTLPPDPEPVGSKTYLEQDLALAVDAVKHSRKDPGDRSGFLYEPVYSSTADRIQYQTGSGLGIGFTTDASWTISQNVRIRPGLDVSIYYAQPLGGAAPDIRDRGDVDQPPAAPSAGIRLEWKF